MSAAGLSPLGDKRMRRTKADLDRLDAAIYTVLDADNPQSVRHVFYRVVSDPDLTPPVPKTDQGYNLVKRRLLILRRAGDVPYPWVVDMSRAGYHVATYADMDDFLRQSAAAYRTDEWKYARTHVEVWTESRSLAAVLIDDCQDMGVSLYPAGGFTSDTFAWQAGEQIERIGKPAVLLYVGDYDPAGVLIDRDVVSKIERHVSVPVTLRRLAITEAQIEQYGLPTKPRKAGDRRRLDVKATVEAEALPAADMRHLVLCAIEEYLDPHTRWQRRQADAAVRETILRLPALAGVAS